ncbi:hypothetical protein [Vibrio sp. FJH11]
MIYTILKKITPKIVRDRIRKYRQRNDQLYMDDEFIEYVYKKKLGLEKNIDNIETLVLRGSHADYGVFTKGENGIYNLGLTSTDAYVSFKLYESYGKRINNLKNVVFFYSVFTPGLSLIKIKERYRLSTYKYFFDIPYQEEGLVNKKLENKIYKKCKKINKVKIDETYFGYDKKNSFIKNITAEQRAKTHIRENRRDPDQLEWLTKLNDMVRKDDRKLYIVIPPAQKSYMDCLPNKSELFAKLHSLDLDNVEILDFYDSPIFDDSDLGDFDHMNEKGAKKLTKELIRHIN